MSDYCLKFKYKCESEYWNMPIRKDTEKEAIKEAIAFIEERNIDKRYIEDAYLIEIIHEEKRVWNYKGEQQ